jgi:hypothetical protein
LLNWLRDPVMAEGKIGDIDLDMIQITDSPAEVVEIVMRSQSSLAELISDDIGIPG